MEDINKFIPKDIMKFSHDIDEFFKGLNMVKGLFGQNEIRTNKKIKSID